MTNRFREGWKIQRDAKRNSTCMMLKIPLSGGSKDFRHINWENYYRDCHKSLYAAARKHGLKIIVWAIETDESYTSVSHFVTVRGVLCGTLPLRIIRALRPCRAYRALWLLEHAIREGRPLGFALSKAVETEHLCRFDRNWKRLAKPIPSQLLMRAITATPWQRLISPGDKPWAYINIATRRIYERYYQTEEKRSSVIGSAYVHPAAQKVYKQDDQTEEKKSSVKASRKRLYTEADDELHIADIPTTLQDAGVSKSAIAVLKAKAEGRRLSDIQLRRSDGTCRPMSATELKAANRELRKDAKKIRDKGIAASTWKPTSSRNLIYQERVPDGKPWAGSRTWAHKFQGEDLERMREIIDEERKDLYTLNNLPICPKRKEGCMTIVNRCEDQRRGKQPCRFDVLAPQEREAIKRPLPKAA